MTDDELRNLVGRLAQQQDRTQQQIDQLGAKVDGLADAQTQTQRQLDQLAIKVDRMSDRVDVFVSEVQRLFLGQAERITQLEGISERIEGLMSYLVRKEGR